MKKITFALFFIFLNDISFFLKINVLHAKCVGKFVNPVTDICWSCIFPITIAGIKLMSGEDTKNSRNVICTCNRPPANLPVPGIPISFWEPVRLVDVTRTPYCLVSMGGICLNNTGLKHRGAVSHSNTRNGLRRSFYQVHWYMYPLIYWLELITDFICIEKNSFDIGYLTELDPTWNNDDLGFIFNPEAVLFGNPIAQAACAADCVRASVGFPRDELFWCGGCQGSLYPFSGTVAAHVGGVQASLLVTQRMIAKLHRSGLLWGFKGKKAYCDKYPMPIIKKTQYKTQMVYPIPSTKKGCYPLGRSEALWASGKEFPQKGEDFAYLIWRKRLCCLTPVR
jgi:conjugal transfer pilus assembly protein TraU